MPPSKKVAAMGRALDKTHVRSLAGVRRGFARALVISPPSCRNIGRVKFRGSIWHARLADHEALAGDWQRVGQYINKAASGGEPTKGQLDANCSTKS